MKSTILLLFFVASSLTWKMVRAADCEYPIVIPEITSISYDPAKGLPRATVTLATSYTIEGFLFWASDAEFEDIFREEPALYPLYEHVHHAVPVHTSQANEHTFSVYTPRTLSLYSLDVKFNVGCQVLTIQIPLSPDNTKNVSYPIRLGKIDKLIPAEVVYKQEEWIDVEMAYSSSLQCGRSQMFFRNSTDHEISTIYDGPSKEMFIIDTNNSGEDTRGNVSRNWMRAKAMPDVKELVVYFAFNRLTLIARPTIAVIAISSFHTDEPTEPIIGIANCAWYGLAKVLEGDVTVIPTNSETEGCVRVYAFGNPTPEVAVAKMSGRSTVTGFLRDNGEYRESSYSIVNANVYRFDKMSPGLEQDYAIVASNSQGLETLRFRSKGYESISIRTLCTDEACDEQGKIHLNSSAVVNLQCQTSGPVEKVIFFKGSKFHRHFILDELSSPDILEEQVATPESTQFSYNYDITSEVLEDLRASLHYRTVLCAAVAQYEVKAAAFQFDIQ